MPASLPGGRDGAVRTCGRLSGKEYQSGHTANKDPGEIGKFQPASLLAGRLRQAKGMLSAAGDYKRCEGDAISNGERVMAFHIIGIDRKGGMSKRLALHALHTTVVITGALLAACGLLLPGSASAATLAQATEPGPPMTLSASATTVLQGQSPVLTVQMPTDATGAVGFYDFARPGADKGIGVAPIIDGVATLTAPDRPLVLGANPIQASYGGNAIYGPADSNTVTVAVVGPSQTLTFTGSQQTVPIPLGAAAVRITATGASGADISGCGVHMPDGGSGALVTGTVALSSAAEQLIVDVGGAGDGQTGGWGGAAGGGNGGHRGGLFPGTGGGGGGATTVQLSSGGLLFPLMAAGGGGGAGDCGEFFSVGGDGGSAGATARNGQNGSGGFSPGSGGTGGTAATPAGTGGTGAGGGGGGGAAGGEGGSGDSQGAAGGGGGAGSSATSRSLVTAVTITTTITSGNGLVTLVWVSGLSSGQKLTAARPLAESLVRGVGQCQTVA
jgi:hypothetical protein